MGRDLREFSVLGVGKHERIFCTLFSIFCRPENSLKISLFKRQIIIIIIIKVSKMESLFRNL